MGRNLINLLIVIILSACSQQKYLTTKWEDEVYKEIESIPVFDYSYESDEKLFYLVTNDSSNIYVRLKAIDESVKRKILLFGFNIWLDTSGKNKKQMGVKFPLPANRGNGERGEESQKNRNDFNGFKNLAIDQFAEMELIGFTGENSSQFSSAMNSNGVSGAIELNERGDIFYLVTIPFKNLGIEYSPDRYLSLNLESGASEGVRREGMTEGRSGRSGGRSGGRGGRSGGSRGGSSGGMQRGGNTQSMQGRQQLTTPIKIQLKKVKLM